MTPSATETGFRHELYPHRGAEEFLGGAVSFIHDALTGAEIVLVSVSPDKEHLLRDELGATGTPDGVVYVDTAALGRNPGRLIPAWREWIAVHARAGRPVRGISESQWSGRSLAESAELRYHEWLLNLAFAQSPAWWLLCPYDVTAVAPETLEAGRRCHPLVLAEGSHRPSPDYSDLPYVHEAFSSPCSPYEELAFSAGDLAAVRGKVEACAGIHGLQGTRLRELLIVCTEVAANSIKYGGGGGTLRTWAQNDTLVCEFHDQGYLDDPMAGRIRPTVEQTSGRGLWLVHQLSDLVQIRSSPETGTTIRLHFAL
jgi:anti-sigma regulatory factor (Ser/Thr protein kinase)